MKKIVCILLASLVLLCLASCGETGTESDGSAVKKDFDPQSVVTQITSKYQLTTGKTFSSKSSTPGEFLDSELVRGFYGDAEGAPDLSQVESYCVYIDESRPTEPCDVGIFVLKEDADKELFVSYLRARIDTKLENAKNYPTVDTSALRTAEVSVEGNVVFYCFVKDGNEDIKKMIGDSIG